MIDARLSSETFNATAVGYITASVCRCPATPASCQPAVGIMPVPPDAPDPDWPPSDDTRLEVKGAEAAVRLWPRVFPGL
jgi:hypothetical protein